MPTVVTFTVSPNSSPTTPDYTSFSAAIAAMISDTSGDLVTADEQYDILALDQGNVSSSSNVINATGFTTDSTRFLRLGCVSGASFRDKAGFRSSAWDYDSSAGFTITSTTGYLELLTLDEPYTIFERIQVSHTGGGGQATTDVQSGATNVVIQDMVYNGSRRMITNQEDDTVIQNCLFKLNGGYACFGAADYTFRFNGVKGSSGSGTGCYASFAEATIQNSWFFDLASDTTAGTSGTFAGDYNATDESSFATGSNNQLSLTPSDELENTSTDFRPKSTGNLQNGTPLSIDVDVSGFDRDDTTPWIGPFELGGGGSTVEATMAEAMTFSEAQSNTALLGSAGAETVTFNEAQSNTALLGSAGAETVTFNDAPSVLGALNSSLVETITLADSLSATASLLAQIAETINFDDAQNTGNLIAAAISESLLLNESQTVVLVVNAAIADTITLSESETVTAQLQAQLSEGIALDDALATQGTFFAAIAEALNFSAVEAAISSGTIKASNGQDLVVIQAADTIIRVKWNGQKLVLIQS